jgi:prepilin-type N-terminal cleavage/methylation domain-containing protein
MNLAFPRNLARRAFTLTEMMIASSLATLLVGGVIVGHIIGLQMFQYTRTKLGGDDDARSALSKLVEEVRSSKVVRIGNGDVSSFKECGVGVAQQGNAIQIQQTTDPATFVRYYLDADTTLRRMTSKSASAPVLAHFVTNRTVFTSEDFSGKILTNNENNRIIGLTLQFYQIQYPIVKIGSNQIFDFYQLRTKIARRALE